MKQLLLLLVFCLIGTPLAQAQIATGDGYVVPLNPVVRDRYRLRNAYPAYPYPAYPVGPNTSPDTVEVGRPYYYYPDPYAYPGGPYVNPGVTNDGNAGTVLGD